jgi:hypothetical protein
MSLRLTPRGRAFLIALSFAGFVTGCVFYHFTAPRFPKSRSDVVANLREPDDYSRQHWELWMCALKGIAVGDIHYVGSDEEFDFFRVEGRRGFFRLLRRSSVLPADRRFPVGQGKPFTVGTWQSTYDVPAISL